MSVEYRDIFKGKFLVWNWTRAGLEIPSSCRTFTVMIVGCDFRPLPTFAASTELLNFH